MDYLCNTKMNEIYSNHFSLKSKIIKNQPFRQEKTREGWIFLYDRLLGRASEKWTILHKLQYPTL